MLLNAATIYAVAFAAALRPDPDLGVSDWAEAKRIVPAEVSAHPGPWRNAFAPEAAAIMDCLAASHPCETVTLKKSAQVFGSEIAMNWLGYIVDVTPGPTLIVHPTVDAGKAWAREKLNPNIEATACLAAKVSVQKSRDGGGSSSLFKKFPGGFAVITGANSTAALRQKSIRFLIKDDWSDWPLDIEGQGDPDKMADARQMSYHASGQAKTFQVSTPTIKGACRIDAAFEVSDQRQRFVPCPQCGHMQVLRFFPVSKDPFRGGLKFETAAPHRAVYICEENGCIIEHHEKAAMRAAGEWRSQAPGPGRQPGFAINTLYSGATTWDKIVEAFLSSKDDPALLKTFWNLWLGEVWEERGEAPEWKLLMLRREDYARRTVPAGGLIFTGFADVQANGLYYEIVAWGPGKTSWSIDIDFLTGDTGDEDGQVWRELTDVFERTYPDALGNLWPVDAFGVDSGYNAHAVYAWVRRRPQAFATKGASIGWAHPPIGTPARVEVTARGKKRRSGVSVWPIGTWQIKAALYANLRKEGPRDGAEAFAPGYCHFSQFHDENYFKQLTAEHLATRQRRDGRTIQEWKASGENHFHDCRVGNMALAEKLGLSRFTFEAWARIAAERGAPPPPDQGDLLTRSQNPLPVKAAPAPAQRNTAGAARAMSVARRLARLNRD